MKKSQKQAAVVGGLAVLALLLVSRKSSASPGEPGSPGGPPMPGEDPDGPGGFDPSEVVIAKPVFPVGPRVPGGGFKPYEAPDHGPIALGEFENPENYPEAGKFHQIEYGDMFFGTDLGSGPGPIAARALYSAAYQAAKEVGGKADDDAHLFARNVVKGTGGAGRRVAYTDLIQCSGWNDFLYGTFGFGKKSHESPHGRAIRLMPHHPDNRQRILSGLAPRRNILMRTPADKRSGLGGPESGDYSGSLEYLWLPGLNLRELWDSKRVTTEETVWDDGSSVIQPPPIVADLGIDYGEEPSVAAFGCLDGTMVLS